MESHQQTAAFPAVLTSVPGCCKNLFQIGQNTGKKNRPITGQNADRFGLPASVQLLSSQCREGPEHQKEPTRTANASNPCATFLQNRQCGPGQQPSPKVWLVSAGRQEALEHPSPIPGCIKQRDRTIANREAK